MTIYTYTRDFKAKVNVCNVVGSAIGISKAMTKLACTSAGADYNTLLVSSDHGDKPMRWDRHLASLYFEGLNRTRYSTL